MFIDKEPYCKIEEDLRKYCRTHNYFYLKKKLKSGEKKINPFTYLLIKKLSKKFDKNELLYIAFIFNNIEKSSISYRDFANTVRDIDMHQTVMTDTYPIEPLVTFSKLKWMPIWELNFFYHYYKREGKDKFFKTFMKLKY